LRRFSDQIMTKPDQKDNNHSTSTSREKKIARKQFSRRYFFGTKLSDKILLIVIFFATAILAFLYFFVTVNPQEFLIFSYISYSLSFAAAYFFGRHFSRQVTNLTLKIEEIAAGNLNKKLIVRGQDEISQLTNALNDLITRLQTNIALDVSLNREIDQAKTDFVALASHQLRTPLAIVKWYVDFLLNGDAGPLTDEQKKFLSQVYFSNERLIELVNALLDVSRIDLGTFSIEPEPVDLIKLADEAAGLFATEMEKKSIRLEKYFSPLPIINLDSRLMKIVLQNLISNATKYTGEKGIIRVIVKPVEDKAMIIVADNGCGIPKEQQPMIFTKLFRADNVKAIESIGTGLGLYIAKAVIEQSGGKIWFESPNLHFFVEKQRAGKNPAAGGGSGTTFYITIPLRGMIKKIGPKKLTSFSQK